MQPEGNARQSLWYRNLAKSTALDIVDVEDDENDTEDVKNDKENTEDEEDNDENSAEPSDAERPAKCQRQDKSVQ